MFYHHVSERERNHRPAAAAPELWVVLPCVTAAEPRHHSPAVECQQHSCCIVVLHIRLNGYLCYRVWPLSKCSPAVSLLFTLLYSVCAQPHITQRSLHCVIPLPRDLPIMLRNSTTQWRSLCSFVLSSAGFEKKKTYTASIRHPLDPRVHPAHIITEQI